MIDVAVNTFKLFVPEAPDETLHDWFQHGKHIEIIGGTTVPEHDDVGFDPIDLVLQGGLALAMKSESSLPILPIVAGMFAGDQIRHAEGGPFGSTSIVSLVDAKIWRMDRQYFDEKIKEPAILKLLSTRRSLDVAYYGNLVMHHARSNGVEKLTRFLLMLVFHMGEREQGNVVLKMTQSNLASLCGIQRESFSTLISSLKKTGVIDTGYRKLIVKNDKKLLEMCQLSSKKGIHRLNLISDQLHRQM